jgi:hypothetical protein
MRHEGALLIRPRERQRPGTFTEIVVWRLPRRLPGSEHRYEYRLALIEQEECVLRYDNESGKGDHRHRGAEEAGYRFTTIERLLEDFDADTRNYLDETPSSSVISRWRSGARTSCAPGRPASRKPRRGSTSTVWKAPGNC